MENKTSAIARSMQRGQELSCRWVVLHLRLQCHQGASSSMSMTGQSCTRCLIPIALIKEKQPKKEKKKKKFLLLVMSLQCSLLRKQNNAHGTGPSLSCLKWRIFFSFFIYFFNIHWGGVSSFSPVGIFPLLPPAQAVALTLAIWAPFTDQNPLTFRWLPSTPLNSLPKTKLASLLEGTRVKHPQPTLPRWDWTSFNHFLGPYPLIAFHPK